MLCSSPLIIDQRPSLTRSNVSSLGDRKAFKLAAAVSKLLSRCSSWKTDGSKGGNHFNSVLARDLKQGIQQTCYFLKTLKTELVWFRNTKVGQGAICRGKYTLDLGTFGCCLLPRYLWNKQKKDTQQCTFRLTCCSLISWGDKEHFWAPGSVQSQHLRADVRKSPLQSSKKENKESANNAFPPSLPSPAPVANHLRVPCHQVRSKALTFPINHHNWTI